MDSVPLLDTLLFPFFVLVNMVATLFEMIRLHLWIAFRLKISRDASLRKLLQLHFKTVLTTKGLILEFFCWIVLRYVVISEWNKICKNCSIAFLFWRHGVVRIICLRGIVVCFLRMPVPFKLWIFYYQLLSSIIPLQLYFYEWAFLSRGFSQLVTGFW